ncbi:hypothetical protein [Paenisporosarcina cavernae]|uniref:hypothetical protein n=1 Tax=Paenisporosarcina cavernae TaxID=2320858 RepID=UPI0013C461DB|nr:hypothetical protein [Paenisporosarcina cavernae]
MIWLFVGSVLVVIVAFAFLLDRRDQKMNAANQNHIISSAKPGESTNYTMGDNRYSSGE